MNNNNSKNAILLLCAYFNNGEEEQYKPLAAVEYGKFAIWLNANNYKPEDLFDKLAEIFSPDPCPVSKITMERIEYLFSRGRSLAMALEGWERKSIWFLTRQCPNYPKLLLERLQAKAPPVLFGVGEPELLNSNICGFVGSKNDNQQLIDFSQDQALLMNEEGFTVASDCTSGSENEALLSALAAGGKGVGLVADKLLKFSLQKQYRKYLTQEKMVLISPFYPDGLTNKSSIKANKAYIHGISNSIVVINCTDNDQTFKGVHAHLKKKWATIYFNSVIGDDAKEKLLALGAKSIGPPITETEVTEPSVIEPNSPDNNKLRSQKLKSPTGERSNIKECVRENISSIPKFLSDYGSLLTWFYLDLHEIFYSSNPIGNTSVRPTFSLKSILQKYPELSTDIANNWLFIFVEKRLLAYDNVTGQYQFLINEQNDSTLRFVSEYNAG